MRKLLVGGALAITLAATSGCVQLIVGGFGILQGLLPISKEQEIAIGAASARQLLASPDIRLYPDAQVTAYVDQVGRTLVQRSGRPDLPWRFFVIDAPQQNAFALPGGFIFVTTGALRAMTNEAQLAGVLGHEIAHVTARHGVEQIRRAMIARGLLVSALGTSPEAARIVGQIGAQLVLRGYGREAELEADVTGATYAARANYDPRALEGFLRVLARAGQAPAWLVPIETHPPVPQRIERLEAAITDRRLAGTELRAASFASAMAPLLGGGAGRGPR